MSLKRRIFTRDFKQQVLREVQAGKSIAQAAREHELHPNLIGKWQKLHEQYAQNAFQGNGHLYTQEAKIAELERLIGQQTVEISLLKKVLAFQEQIKAEREGRQMSQVISALVQQGYSLSSCCQAFGLPRASYYRLLQEPNAKTDDPLRPQVRQVALDWSCYGYRRITHELKRQGVMANHKRVLRLMREENLVRRPKKRFVATTNSDHRLPVYPNLAADMDVTAPDQLWVSDLTYIRLGHEFIYLAVVLDACSRRCLGWSLGRRLDAALATSALKMALTERKPAVHHSDRGVQYASGEYTRPAERKRHCHQHEQEGKPLR